MTTVQEPTTTTEVNPTIEGLTAALPEDNWRGMHDEESPAWLNLDVIASPSIRHQIPGLIGEVDALSEQVDGLTYRCGEVLRTIKEGLEGDDLVPELAELIESRTGARALSVALDDLAETFHLAANPKTAREMGMIAQLLRDASGVSDFRAPAEETQR